MTQHINEPTFLNPDDWASHFWKRNYRITLDLGVSFWVNADCEHDALDVVIDHCAIHCPGFIARYDDLDAGEGDVYITGGNEGLTLTTDTLYILEV